MVNGFRLSLLDDFKYVILLDFWTCLISSPGNDIPRLFHHLGPRYTSNFQSSSLVRFFTYDAATSLSIYLQSRLDSKRATASDLTPLIKGSRDGVGVSEDAIVFSLTPAGYQSVDTETGHAMVLNGAARKDRIRDKAEVKGDVVVAKPQCLDVSLWKIGGAAIGLRLMELSTVRDFSFIKGIPNFS